MDLTSRRDTSMSSETDHAANSPSYSPPPPTRSPTPESPYRQPPPPPTPAKGKIVFRNHTGRSVVKRNFRNENQETNQEFSRNDGFPPPLSKYILKSSESHGGIYPFPPAKDGDLLKHHHNSKPRAAASPEIFPRKTVHDFISDLLGDPKQALTKPSKSPYQKSIIKPRVQLRIPQPPPIVGSLTRSIVHRKKLSDEVLLTDITFTDDPAEDSYERFLARVTESAGMTNNKEMVLGMLIVNWDNGTSLQDAGVKVGSADKQSLATRIGSEQDWRDTVKTMRQHRWANQGWTAWWWENKGTQPVGLYF